MAGPNLELFRFGLYLFFPLAVMVHYGDPQWYHDNVLPFRERFLPSDRGQYKPPRNPEDARAELAELRAKRLARRDARQEGGTTGPNGDATRPQNSTSGTLMLSLRPGGSVGSFAQIHRTHQQTWRESWDEAKQRRVV